MKVIFVNVNKGDCILILSDQFACMIDTGAMSEFKKVYRIIKKHGIEKLNALILTHPHLDHTGSYELLTEKLEIHSVYMPRCMVSKKDNNKFIFIEAGNELFIEESFSMVVLAPYSKRYRDLNDYSVVMKLCYKNVSFLFAGDATTLSEEEILSNGYDLKCDVLKVGHHGKDDSSSINFLQAARPKYSVITTNDLENVGAEVIKRLNYVNSKIYYTGADDDIEFETDGNSISIHCNTERTSSFGMNNITKVGYKMENFILLNNKKQLINLIGKYSKIEIEDEFLSDDISLDNDLGIDSIMLLQLVVDIEDEFSISISDDELDTEVIGTFGGLLSLINEKTARIE